MTKKGGPSRTSFIDLERYLLFGKEKDQQRDATGDLLLRPDLVAHWSHGVANDATAGLEMQAIASRPGHAKSRSNPLYHFVVSTRPGEVFSEQNARIAVDAGLRSLGANRGHAYKAATHFDEDTGRYHTHVMANRRSTSTGKLLVLRNDFFKLARAAEWCERELGLQVDRKANWRRRVSDRDLGIEVERVPVQQVAAAERLSWVVVMAQTAPGITAARSWDDVHAALAPFGATIRASRSGFTLTAPDDTGRHAVKLSELGISADDLKGRLGPFEAGPERVAPARGTPEADKARAALVALQAEVIAKDPALVIERLGETRSTWTPDDVTRETARILGVKFEHRAAHAEAFERIVAEVLGRCEEVGPQIFTTTAIRREEEAMFRAAQRLYDTASGPRLRQPSKDLDAQQRAAFTHLATDRGLAVQTGIAGAGKSRALRDLAAAYTEQGYRVIGTAVSGEAARVLGEEANIETRNVAKLLYDLTPGPDGTSRDRLTERTVVFVDEAGTMGTAQAKALFEHARAARSLVRLTGDTAQYASVGRGAVLRGLVEHFGAHDMPNTRRAQEAWLREAVVDMRAGRVATALGALRDHGGVLEYTTRDEAKAALVRRYADSIEQGRSALLLASTNSDVNDLAERVQTALRDAGRLGPARAYATDFGEQSFAVGDRLMARTPNRDAGKSNNRDTFVVIAHRLDGQLELRRERDGVRVTWDVAEFPALTLAYAQTSNSAQGRTVDDLLALQTGGSLQQGYVDLSRARQSVTFAHGLDDISGFSALQAYIQRDAPRMNVADAVAAKVAAQKVAEAERIAAAHAARIAAQQQAPAAVEVAAVRDVWSERKRAKEAALEEVRERVRARAGVRR